MLPWPAGLELRKRDSLHPGLLHTNMEKHVVPRGRTGQIILQTGLNLTISA